MHVLISLSVSQQIFTQCCLLARPGARGWGCIHELDRRGPCPLEFTV